MTLPKQSNNKPKARNMFLDAAFDEQGNAPVHQILHGQHAELCQSVQQTCVDGGRKHMQRDRVVNVAK